MDVWNGKHGMHGKVVVDRCGTPFSGSSCEAYINKKERRKKCVNKSFFIANAKLKVVVNKFCFVSVQSGQIFFLFVYPF